MNTYYSAEKNVQILIALMKAHGIKKVIASPGTTNIALVASIQQDNDFEIYSSVDERSAAYIASGLAAESGEPVALSCTGATASRNYIPALTEAYYRKLPILAITSTQHTGKVGQYVPQVIDRSNIQNDIAKISVQLPTVTTDEDEWACNTTVNNALLELRRNGGGPVHINLATTYNRDFTVKSLPKTRVINRYTKNDCLPEIKQNRIGIFVGSHNKWNDDLTHEVEIFCEKYNGVVLCDHSSNYKGKYSVQTPIVTTNKNIDMELLIHLGDVSGTYMSFRAKDIWRVSSDGEIRDTYQKLKKVFQMEEIDFFKYYNSMDVKMQQISYYNNWLITYEELLNEIPEMPFSNPWIAQQTAKLLPSNSVLHLGILNSLRSWNFFEVDKSILGYSNTGGFGIDGCVSSLIGASLADNKKLFFGVIGDLSFFYDLNSLGNRHIGNNLRILLINNGKGTEFRQYNHPASRFGDEADSYMAAGGHFGNKSSELVKHYAEDLGYEYITASNKEEYLANVGRFITSEITDKPMIFEVFTNNEDESNAIEIMNTLYTDSKTEAKNMVKNLLGDKGVKAVKKILRK
ncbi:MAG: thiamine pyrophosphate-binding protein [Bacillota bacterium]